ncbi:lysophospholipid acyltransferase family protein [Gloeocapsopsis dulcis]|uniref:1-acyl-sn-glycerol-3-phosphate acyltransferase n=1 Tax=Gloeocapsopsis dulcis AAB1 = 1H9 TaxID=1433147 RepID=A0A6N8FUH4_9CHRO|nr:lysophospholipid acyltransferase family protein [Gloeocapsopsis dulcis]MUL36753.1 1-acyl-sn-glycerol-3-phosphate acyltransferase [Gloeocapsopsis dulcis AAB1 = 1H9]WNN91325.1 lysophospholipid acyltransferase family protein [Gloeocapsopsis dulcis]
MSANNALQVSQGFLASVGTQMFRYYEDRIPRSGPVLVVSNHRSFMDAPILMTTLERPIRFACHHYMAQVPVMREIVTDLLGCFPLEAKEKRQQGFFQQALNLLNSSQVVGIFPEGTRPMVTFTQPDHLGEFQRGFAHLALRGTTSGVVPSVQNLTILPIAIASLEEVNTSAVPLKLLSLFDPSEPLFNQSGWHPLVIYRRVAVLVGRPYWISHQQQMEYQGKQAKNAVADLTHYCQEEIAQLLRQGFY